MNVAVLGVGLIGGSIGLASRARAGAHVAGWDSDRTVLDRALALGAIDAAGADIAEAVRDAEVVFVAAPVGALPEVLRAALQHAPAEAIVTDVGSTKCAIADAVTDRRFVPGHPLAGSEVSGVQHAHADLFEGAVWYLASPAGAPPELEDLIRAFAAHPVTIDPALHDRLMATVSHLPHVLANLLVGQATDVFAEDPSSPAGLGPSFRDATRVAGSNSAIWTDIYMSNREALTVAIDELAGRLADVRASLAAGDEQAVRDWNERARSERDALLGPGS